MVVFNVRQKVRNGTVGQGVIEKQGKEWLKHVTLHIFLQPLLYIAPTSQQLVELQTSNKHFYS